jgi:6-phosphogluconolactonase (cycloisomerase 2 family)
LQDIQESDLGISGLAGAMDVAVSPDGKSVYVVSSPSVSPGGGGAVVLFRRNPAQGTLTFIEAYSDGGELLLDRPVAVTVSPTGSHVYIASYHDDALMVFDRDPGDGSLTAAYSLTDGGDIDGLDGVQDVVTSPDGAQIYVSAALDNALSVFEWNSASNRFGFAASYQDGVSWVDGLESASKIVTCPQGEHVYVSGYQDNAIAAFRTLNKVFIPITEK